jgi:prepilin-type N-terminal cleavage/methylation domain-containing protein/prepilin-type processing-associated H-X9-DG protein
MPSDQTMNVQARQLGEGFSLVELLVVVTILSLLLMIAAPSLRGARESARAVVCASNQRQMGMAFQVYLKNHNRFFPFYRSDENAGAATTGADLQYHWFERLRWAIGGSREIPKTFEAWLCPSDKTPGYDADNLSYGYNYTHLGDWPPRVITRYDKIRQPWATIVTADSDEDVTGIGRWGSVISPPDYGPGYIYPVGERHGGDGNVLFADWRVGRHDAELINLQVRDPNNPADPDYWWDVNEDPRIRYAN